MSITVVVGYALTLALIPLVLARKRDPTVALGWCLAIIFLPYVGTIIFLTFGNTSIERPLSRKRRHRLAYAALTATARPASAALAGWAGITHLAQRLGAFPPSDGNAITHYAEGVAAFAAKEAAIASATDHIYAEYFIWEPDATGQKFLALLAAKAAEGVRVCLLYDAIGSYTLREKHLRPLHEAGGLTHPFLPLSLWRRRVQITLRNHRKLLMVDGRVGFMGGMNMGDEYIHQGKRKRYWRDTHLRLEGPAVAHMEQAFAEDWHFACGELRTPAEPWTAPPGDRRVQIVTSGPDQEHNAIHEIYFAAMARCTRRLWITSPYFVPGPALMMAMQATARLGVDVRLLCQGQPDKWLPYLAANYYWEDMIASGVRIYRYTRGMLHSKVILVDGQWASVGTANWDIRSLRLNFEINALSDDPQFVAELEAQFHADLVDAEEIDLDTFRQRSHIRHAAENVCRLFSGIM